MVRSSEPDRKCWYSTGRRWRWRRRRRRARSRFVPRCSSLAVLPFELPLVLDPLRSPRPLPPPPLPLPLPLPLLASLTLLWLRPELLPRLLSPRLSSVAHRPRPGSRPSPAAVVPSVDKGGNGSQLKDVTKLAWRSYDVMATSATTPIPFPSPPPPSPPPPPLPLPVGLEVGSASAARCLPASAWRLTDRPLREPLGECGWRPMCQHLISVDDSATVSSLSLLGDQATRATGRVWDESTCKIGKVPPAALASQIMTVVSAEEVAK
mmetsp:Transcript_9045/g.21241  ORF Transcript_9045/g.21241 Transcript_9045/m.21241 type:complete len:265 (-) Transcript_9045:165-959(-)